MNQPSLLQQLKEDIATRLDQKSIYHWGYRQTYRDSYRIFSAGLVEDEVLTDCITEAVEAHNLHIKWIAQTFEIKESRTSPATFHGHFVNISKEWGRVFLYIDDAPKSTS